MFELFQSKHLTLTRGLCLMLFRWDIFSSLYRSLHSHYHSFILLSSLASASSQTITTYTTRKRRKKLYNSFPRLLYFLWLFAFVCSAVLFCFLVWWKCCDMWKIVVAASSLTSPLLCTQLLSSISNMLLFSFCHIIEVNATFEAMILQILTHVEYFTESSWKELSRQQSAQHSLNCEN